MKRIITTPAGRKRYMEILLTYLKKQKNSFDEYHIWLNTLNTEDISYLKGLSEEYEWIKLIEPSVEYSGNLSIYTFFKSYAKENEVYLRLDDDIVFMEDGAMDRIFKFRIDNPQYFLVYGNIFNNSVITHIHQRIGAISLERGFNPYKCFTEGDGTAAMGWEDGVFAAFIHENFIEDVKQNTLNKYKFPKWILAEYQRVSINCISWLGSEFAKFSGEVGKDEEQWLSVDKPKSIKKPNVIYGDAIFSHYAFHTQRPFMDESNFVKKYRELCGLKD